MENLALLSVVAFSQSQDDLDKYLPNNILSYVVIVSLAFLDKLGHVSILTVFHHNVDPLRLFVYDSIPNN
jgi:hypothetical protein